MKRAYSIDLYNMAVYKEEMYTLKAVQGGDDVPRVMIVEDEASDRRGSIQSMHHRGGIKDIEFGG